MLNNLGTYKAYAPVPIVRETTLKGKFLGNGADWVWSSLDRIPLLAWKERLTPGSGDIIVAIYIVEMTR